MLFPLEGDATSSTTAFFGFGSGYFSSSPYNQDDHSRSELIKGLVNLDFSFMYERRWHDKWPLDEITSKKIPTLIRIDFSIGEKDFFWLIDPNIDYAYQG